jgi:hypothetical protein
MEWDESQHFPMDLMHQLGHKVSWASSYRKNTVVPAWATRNT